MLKVIHKSDAAWFWLVQLMQKKLYKGKTNTHDWPCLTNFEKVVQRQALRAYAPCITKLKKVVQV